MRRNGFTLIELMIVVAIVAILAAIALPTYQDYVIKTKITEGIVAAIPVKTMVAEGFLSNGLTGVQSVGAQYPVGNTSSGSKYVREVNVDAADGHIDIVFQGTASNGIPGFMNGGIITMTPNIVTGANTFVAVSPGASGAVDWACASSTSQTAASRGMVSVVPASPIPSRYAPVECR